MSNVDVTILSRTFNIACPTEKHDTLRSAAKMLDNELHNLRGSMASGVDFEKLAVTAALNFCARYERLVHEFEAQMTSIMEMNNELAARLEPIAQEREADNTAASVSPASDSEHIGESNESTPSADQETATSASASDDEPMQGFDAGEDDHDEAKSTGAS